MVATPDCREPEVPFDNETCLNDPNCHQNVTVCYVEGCCAFKECDDSGECFVAMPDCLIPVEEYQFVDNETCFNDENCHRSVTVCSADGCCAYKECDDNGQCFIALPMCIGPEPIEEVLVAEENPTSTEKSLDPESSAEDKKSGGR